MNRCGETRPLLDAWLDDETGQNEHDAVAEHLETCQDCAGIAEARRALRARIRSAVATTPGADRRLRGQVLSHVGASAQSGSRWQYLAIAAAVLVTAAIYGTWRGPGAAMEAGLTQHIHCAVERTYADGAPAPAAAEMASSLGPDYADLLPVVEKNVPPDYRVVMAHHCSYKGRQYVHLVARNAGQLISLLVTQRDAGEAFENDLRAVASEASSDLYSARSKGFSAAGFETPRYFVYLVSSMDEGRNLRVFQAMMPAVKTALT